MSWKLLILVLIAILIILYLASYRGEVRISKLEIAWPSPEEVIGRWCGSGTRSASIEVILISCDEECHALLRYWMFAPTNGEVEKNVPIEIWKDGRKIGGESVVARKGKTGMYVQTPVMLLTIPNGAEIRVFGSSVKIPYCTGRDWRSPQVIYVKGSLNGWKQVGDLELISLSDGLFAIRWKGKAKLSCGDISVDLKGICSENGFALVSVVDGCNLEVGERSIVLRPRGT